MLNIRKSLIENQIGAVPWRTIGLADELIGTNSFFSKTDSLPGIDKCCGVDKNPVLTSSARNSYCNSPSRSCFFVTFQYRASTVDAMQRSDLGF